MKADAKERRYGLQYVQCAKCGVTDKSHNKHVGTSVKMRCPDCANAPDTHATMCRACCPTGHGTEWK
jgi:translation initiation factor 2 beta subunit (eIF-2beta)/eIF-5